MTKKILMIENDADFIEAVSIPLQANNYTVVSAGDGKQGLKMAQTEKPDLILLDVIMKTKTEGIEIARQLKSGDNTKHIPIILLTGIRKEFNLPFGFEADEEFLPVTQIVEKPVKPEQLLKTIRELIG
ncbi:MAG: response regulator [Chitinivibrionales bacterium]|nr:response regulator [Chitinivibrionales bacterium]